jgi:hypothetical protein
MSIFISHAFRDKPFFDNIADSLDDEGIKYWDPDSILPGAPLSERLREAIERSQLCVFIATANSVASAWCAAELGAFWGANKPVLVFVADPTLRDEQLPGQLRGHFLERRIKKLVAAIQNHHSAWAAKAADAAATTSDISSELTRNEILGAIETALDRAHTRQLAGASMSQVAVHLASAVEKDGSMSEPAIRTLGVLLGSLVGLPKASIHERAAVSWPHTTDIISTTTGVWIGYALDRWLGTSPWLVVAGIVLGSAVGFYEFVRLLAKLD